jgi:hypothetical protein
MRLATRRTLMQNIQLVTKDQDFDFQASPRLKPIAQHAQEQATDRYHPAMMFRFAPTRESIGWSFRKRQVPVPAPTRLSEPPAAKDYG